jgi:hypothetical protein
LYEFTKEKNLDFIVLSKTGRANFPQTTLNNICIGRDFLWHCMALKGRSGGMILGIHLLTFDIGEIEEGDFYIRFKVRHKEEDFRFSLIAVYGLVQAEHKSYFLSEMVRVCSKEALPIIIGGDFNIIQSPDEKNNANYNDRWTFMFNVVIDTLNLREIVISGRKYTWANRRKYQTFEKIRQNTCLHRFGV